VCDYINGCNITKSYSSPLKSPPPSSHMAPIAFGSSLERHTPLNGYKKVEQETLDGFGTRAIHAGSEPDPSTGAVIPAISLSTTYKQHGVGNHKVRVTVTRKPRYFFLSLFCHVRDLNTRDRGTPIEALLSKRYHRSNPAVLTLSHSPRVLPQPPRSFSPSATTHISSASMTFMAAPSVT
jgi:hypothetical protein